MYVHLVILRTYCGYFFVIWIASFFIYQIPATDSMYCHIIFCSRLQSLRPVNEVPRGVKRMSIYGDSVHIN